ncbi:MAG: porin family protein [candidate division KSB1 bacterium]|nr:porin family protein [candidate division KSB1 bacterium]
MKKHTIWVAGIVLLSLAIVSGAWAQQRLLSFLPYAGLGKATGEGSEYWKMGFTIGGGVLYPIAPNIQIGGRVGFVRFSPNEDKLTEDIRDELGIPSGELDIDLSGSFFRSLEFMGLVRVSSVPAQSGGPSFFGQAGFGYCSLAAKTKTKVTYQGLTFTEEAEDSEGQPGISLGAGIRFGKGVAVEIMPAYTVIFTEDESTKYFTVTVGAIF